MAPDFWSGARRSNPSIATLCNGCDNAKAAKLKLEDVEQVYIKQGKGSATLPMLISEAVPSGCVCIPRGIEAVKNLGDATAAIELEKVS